MTRATSNSVPAQGNLPDSPWGSLDTPWPEARVRHLFRVVNGSTPSSRVQEYWDGNIPWATPEDVKDTGDGRLADTARKITKNGYASCGTELVPEGTIVLTTRAPIGKLAITTRPLCTNQGCKSLVPHTDIDARFYYYTLLAARKYLELLGEGATFSELGTDDLKGVILPNPGKKFQIAISDFLDHHTTRIDALIEKKGRMIDLLEEKRKAVVIRAVTKGLDPEAEMVDSGVGWIGKIPSHWDVARIKHVAEMQSGHTPSKSTPEYWTDCDIPWVSLADSARLRRVDYIEETEHKINEAGLANSSARILPPGTVVFSRDATVGLCAITTVPLAVSQHFVAWICKPEIRAEYLLNVVKAMGQELDRLTMGSTISTIGMPDLRGLSTPLPPVKEQDAILARINQEQEAINHLRKRMEMAIELLREKRQALITAAVTGQIDVTDWQPPKQEASA